MDVVTKQCSFKGPPLCLRSFLTTESSFKNREKCFLFTLISCSDFCVHAEKRHGKKAQSLLSVTMTSSTGKLIRLWDILRQYKIAKCQAVLVRH